MTEINILSGNVQGLGLTKKINDVFNHFKSKQYQMYCLQDVHFIKSMGNSIHKEWPYDFLFIFGKSKSRGVAILFSNDLHFIIHNHISDPEGKYITVNITIDNNKLTLISLFEPNQDSPICLII